MSPSCTNSVGICILGFNCGRWQSNDALFILYILFNHTKNRCIDEK